MDKIESKIINLLKQVRQRKIFMSVLGLIACLHLWIFFKRLQDFSLFQTEVALQWVISAALVLLAVFFRSQKIALFRGRSGLVFWVLVLFLHFVGVGSVTGDPGFSLLTLEEPVLYGTFLVLILSGGSFLIRLHGLKSSVQIHIFLVAKKSDYFLNGFIPQLFSRPPPLLQ